MPPFVVKWEKELGSHLEEQQKSKVLREKHSFAMDVTTIEMNYKRLSKWYITRVKAQKYQPE